MKKILNQIFVTLGVLFLIVLLIGLYFFVTDPFNLRPLFFGSGSTQAKSMNVTDTKVANDTEGSESLPLVEGGFQLSAEQQQSLINLGIDPATIPQTITADQEACFVSVLGEARVEEIKAGAVPNALEFFRAKACI